MKHLFQKLLLGFAFLLILPGCYAEDFNSQGNSSTLPSTITPANPDILLFEDFSDPERGWWIGKDDNAEAYYSNGKYHVKVYQNDFGNCSFTGKNYTDAVISVDILHISGSSETKTGITFRDDQDSNGYVFFITNNGYFYADKYVDNNPSRIIRPSRSEQILIGNNTNEVTIAMHGGILEFFINDSFIGSVEDNSYANGDIGLCVFPSDVSDAEYAFDNLIIYKYNPLNPNTPKQPKNTPTPYYRPVTWMELADFISRDHTNWNQYDINNYVCLDFAIDLVENAKKENIKAWIVAVDFTNGEIGHAFVAFETSDKGIRYVEPQRDYTYSNLTIGNPLCDDWGQDQCMGIVKSIENLGDCDHDHYCTDFEP